MRSKQARSIALNSSAPQRVYRTFEDWESEQLRDTRTPEERGIQVGSSVMWRHRQNGIIMTDRAIVLAINNDMLTLQVKDVKERKSTVPLHEIVVNEDDRSKK